MKLLSTTTDLQWISYHNPVDDQTSGTTINLDAQQKLTRYISDVLLAENLVVLTGLGTSLCVKDQQGNGLAPTMNDLWNAASDAAGAAFEQVKQKAKYRADGGNDNIETLLSFCHLAEELESDPIVKAFIEKTESIIVSKCSFVEDETLLPVHEPFLRKVARRSTRLPRMKLFTTNYDLCFEAAANRSRFIVIDGFSHTLRKNSTAFISVMILCVATMIERSPISFTTFSISTKFTVLSTGKNEAIGRSSGSTRPRSP